MDASGSKKWIAEGEGVGGRCGFRVFISIPEGVSLENSEPSMVIMRRVLLIMCKRTNMVDKPGTFVETNLAQMPAYSVYRGTHAGDKA
jgi:hypothetical protein